MERIILAAIAAPAGLILAFMAGKSCKAGRWTRCAPEALLACYMWVVAMVWLFTDLPITVAIGVFTLTLLGIACVGVLLYLCIACPRDPNTL